MDLLQASCLFNIVLLVVIAILMKERDSLSDRLKKERGKIKQIDEIINPVKYNQRKR